MASNTASMSICGWSIPFRLDPATHGVARQNDAAAKLRENVIHIVLTAIGERVMRPDYGAGMRELLHETENAVLLALARQQIARAIVAAEPRVMLQEVQARREEGSLFIDVQYVIRKTQVADAVSVPFAGGVL